MADHYADIMKIARIQQELYIAGMRAGSETSPSTAKLRQLGALESRLDYDYARSPGDVWIKRAERAVSQRPLDVPSSVRGKFAQAHASICPSCGRPMALTSRTDSFLAGIILVGILFYLLA